MQLSQQINSIVMALAGAERIFALMDETPETDDGYVRLVNAKKDANGTIIECEEHTGMWAWKHPHGDGTLTYTALHGDVQMNDVDFGYVEEKRCFTMFPFTPNPVRRLLLWAPPVPVKPLLPT